VAGALVLPLSSPVLFLRSNSWAQTGWILCYLVGVEAMFVASALFHRGHWSPARRRTLRRLDHAAIFVAITGSYLAVVGLTTHGTLRLVVLLVVATGSLVGAVVRVVTIDRPTWVNTMSYGVVSWTGVAILPQLYRGGGPLCFGLVFGAGVAYSLGALAYAAKWPPLWPRVFGYHELFHVGTLLGAALTFAGIAVALR
jgi:hemolysin III